MRKAIVIVLAVMLAAAPFACGTAEAGAENGENGYSLAIDDGAGLLDSGETEQVRQAMLPITEYASAGFVTIASNPGGTAPATLARQWGESRFGGNVRFTVFIIDLGTRHLDIYASQPLSGVLTASEENSIADNVYRYATNGEYGKCAVETFSQIERVLKGEKIATPMKYISNGLMSLIAAILAAYLLISAWARKEQAVSMPDVIRGTAAGAATVVTANRLKKVVHHESSSHGGGGGGFSGGGGGGGSSGGHGF